MGAGSGRMCEKSQIAVLKCLGAPSLVPGCQGNPCTRARGTQGQPGGVPDPIGGRGSSLPARKLRGGGARRSEGAGVLAWIGGRGSPRSTADCGEGGNPWARAGPAADTCPSRRSKRLVLQRLVPQPDPERPPVPRGNRGVAAAAARCGPWGEPAAPGVGPCGGCACPGREEQGGKHRSSPTCMTELTGVRLSSSPLGPTQNIRIMVSPSSVRWTCVDSGSAPGATTIIWGSGETIWRVWTM